MTPTGVRKAWEKNDVETQARLLAYDQIRQLEEAELAGLKIGV